MSQGKNDKNKVKIKADPSLKDEIICYRTPKDLKNPSNDLKKKKK